MEVSLFDTTIRMSDKYRWNIFELAFESLDSVERLNWWHKNDKKIMDIFVGGPIEEKIREMANGLRLNP